MQILLADDDLVTRHMAASLLKKSGHEVVLAADGSEALAILQAPNAPGVAILDWIMPGLDGIEVCKRVRAATSDSHYTYLMSLTSKNGHNDLVQALEAGFDDFVTKPVNHQELNARLLVARRIIELQERLLLSCETMKIKATHDALTGLWNRAAIMDFLSSEINRTERVNGNLTVLMVDVDFFKKVNDTHGHLVGDQVLKRVAQNLILSVRTYDWVGRYGGEEFLVIAPGCAPGGSGVLAERLRRLVAGRPINIDGIHISVTVSVGVANSQECGFDPLQLLKAADTAVYRAKQNGRNRVEIQSDPVELANDSVAKDTGNAATTPSVDHCESSTTPKGAARRISWSAVQLPPFSPVAAKALQLANQDDSSLARLADLIASDLAFSSEILSIANSAFFSLSQMVNSVQQAVALLGMERIRGVAVTIGLRNFLGASVKHPVLEVCWQHSLACAMVAEELASAVKLDRGVAYTGGIMHDVGRVALAVIHSQQYADFLENVCGAPEELLLLERKAFSIDHCEAGRRLIYEWELPNDFVELASHHHFRQRNTVFDLPALIRWSCEAADIAGFTSAKRISLRPYAELLGELPAGVGANFHQQPQELAAKVKAKIDSMLSPH